MEDDGEKDYFDFITGICFLYDEKIHLHNMTKTSIETGFRDGALSKVQ